MLSPSVHQAVPRKAMAGSVLAILWQAQDTALR